MSKSGVKKSGVKKAAKSASPKKPTVTVDIKATLESLVTKAQDLSYNDKHAYQALIAPYQNALPVKALVDAFCIQLKSQSRQIQINQALKPVTETSINELNTTLCKRLNASFFFLEAILPLDKDAQEYQLILLNILWEDMSYVFRHKVEKLTDNSLNPGEFIPYFEFFLNCYAVFEKYSDNYITFLDSILAQTASHVSETTRQAASSALFHSYANLIKISADFAYVCNLFGTQQRGINAFNTAARLTAFMQKKLAKIVKITHLSKESAQQVLDESLKAKVEFLKNLFAHSIAFPLQDINCTLFTFTQEYLKNLSGLSHNQKTLDDEKMAAIRGQLNNAIEQASHLNPVDVAALDETIQSQLTSLHFKNALIGLSCLDEVNVTQAQRLLPLYRDLLFAWRKFFMAQNTIYAKIVAEKLFLLARKTVSMIVTLSKAPTILADTTQENVVPAPTSQTPHHESAQTSSTTIKPTESTAPTVVKLANPQKQLARIKENLKQFPNGALKKDKSQKKPQRLMQQIAIVKNALLDENKTQSSLQRCVEQTVSYCHELNDFAGDPMLSALLNAASDLMLSWRDYFVASNEHEAAKDSSQLSGLMLQIPAVRVSPEPVVVKVLDVTENKVAQPVPLPLEKLNRKQRRALKRDQLNVKELAPINSDSDTDPDEQSSLANVNQKSEIAVVDEQSELAIVVKKSEITAVDAQSVSSLAEPKTPIETAQDVGALPTTSSPKSAQSQVVEPAKAAAFLPYQMKKKKQLRKPVTTVVEDLSEVSVALAPSKKELRAKKKAQRRAVQEDAKRALALRQKESAVKKTESADELMSLQEDSTLTAQMAALSLASNSVPPPSSTSDATAPSLTQITQNLDKLTLSPATTLLVKAEEYVPKYISKAPTSVRVPVPDEVKAILTKLNNNGYYAVLVGGAVRDTLLSRPINDYDIVTNCEADALNNILDGACHNKPATPNTFQTAKNIDIYCSKLPLEEELRQRDFTINTLIADRDGMVYDYLNALPHLADPFLHTIGDLKESFTKDPAKLLRLVRYANTLNKYIHQKDFQDIAQCATQITTIPFGVYLRNIELLFTRGKAVANLTLFCNLCISQHLVPFVPEVFFSCDLRPFRFFLHEKLQHIDTLEETHRKEKISTYSILGLLLMPQVLNHALSLKDIKLSIEKTVSYFCDNYKGEFSEVEKACFKKNLEAVLHSEHHEYLNSLPKYLDILARQEQAFRLQQELLALQVQAKVVVLTPGFNGANGIKINGQNHQTLQPHRASNGLQKK